MDIGGSPEEREKKKVLAALSITRCSEERKKVRECFKKTVFGFCTKEQNAFWECFVEVSYFLNIILLP